MTPVVPIVFYHGRAAWRIGTRFGELIDFGDFDELREYVPDFDYHLCDLSRYTDAQIVGEPALRFGLSLLKYIFRRRELMARLEEFLTIYRPLYGGGRWDFLLTALTYLTRVVPHLPRERLQDAVAAVFADDQGVIMETIAEEWIKEGREIGRRLGLELGLQQGSQEEAAKLTLRLLHKHLGGLDDAMEHQIRELPVDRLEELSLAASELRNREDLNAWLRSQSPARQA